MKRMLCSLAICSAALVTASSALAQNPPDYTDAQLPVMLGNYNVERDFGICFARPQANQSGLLVDGVADGSLAQSLNFRRGDIVLTVNKVPLLTKLQLASALGFNYNELVHVVVQRGSKYYAISIQPAQINTALLRNSMSRPMW